MVPVPAAQGDGGCCHVNLHRLHVRSDSGADVPQLRMPGSSSGRLFGHRPSDRNVLIRSDLSRTTGVGALVRVNTAQGVPEHPPCELSHDQRFLASNRPGVRRPLALRLSPVPTGRRRPGWLPPCASGQGRATEADEPTPADGFVIRRGYSPTAPMSRSSGMGRGRSTSTRAARSSAQRGASLVALPPA